MGFPFRTSKFKNDVNYIKYKFSHKFEKVCTLLNKDSKIYNNLATIQMAMVPIDML